MMRFAVCAANIRIFLYRVCIASGGYYIAAAADGLLFVDKASIVGSIGVDVWIRFYRHDGEVRC